MTDLPFEQWHPDAQRQCGFWWDLSPVACGQCERCRKEQRGHPVMSEQMTEREWELEARRLERLQAVAPPTPHEPSEPFAEMRRELRADGPDSHRLLIWLGDLEHQMDALRAENTRLRKELPDELRLIAAWIRTPGNVSHDDAIDECARVLENRARALAALTPDGSQS